MTMYMLIDCTKYELPLDVALTLKELAVRASIPYQTLRNRLCDGRRIAYCNCRVIRVDVPNENQRTK